MENDQSREIALNIIKGHNNLTMATCSKNLIPNATPHEYLYLNENIYIEISPNHQSVLNLQENPVVHFVIFDQFIPNQIPRNPYVLQTLAKSDIFEYKEPNIEEFDEVWNEMVKKFPFMSIFKKEQRVLLKFIPEKGDLIKFSKKRLEKFHFNY